MAKRPRPSHEPSSDRPRRGRTGRSPSRLEVVYEDADLLIVDKPCGIPTAIPPAAKSSQRTLFDLAKEHVRRGATGRTRVWVVHRLDGEASGLVAFAKSPRAFEWLKEDLRARRMNRAYLALVEGVFPSDQAAPGSPVVGTIQSMLQEGQRGDVRVVQPNARPSPPPRIREAPLAPGDARHAVLRYEVVASGDRHSLVRIRLETGRKHQIRVQMASIGHPVAGDDRYGAKTDPLRRVALHAAELEFAHPTTGQPILLRSAAPPAFWTSVGAEPPAPLASEMPEPSRGSRRPAAARTSWDEVAGWYDDLVEDRRNDLHNDVVIPGTLRLLEPRRGQRVLDLACGQGVLSRELEAGGVLVWGVDASPRLVQVAQGRSRGARFAVGDATRLEEVPSDFWPAEGFDSVACVMSLMNIDPLSSALSGAAAMLRPGGRFVAVLLHPVFRSPGRTSWGWEEAGGSTHQFRRIGSYLSPGRSEITMNPGKAARGAKPVVTWTYHRPLQTYVQQFSAAGLLIERLEEWPSPRRSQPGPRAEEENRARREIPMFLGIRAIRRSIGEQPAASPAGTSGDTL